MRHCVKSNDREEEQNRVMKDYEKILRGRNPISAQQATNERISSKRKVIAINGTADFVFRVVLSTEEDSDGYQYDVADIFDFCGNHIATLSDGLLVAGLVGKFHESRRVPPIIEKIDGE